MQLEFLGGALEVGRAAVAAHSTKSRSSACLDYGMMAGEEPEFPALPSRAVQAVVLSHSHLDHVGGAPVLYKTGNPALVCNSVTFDSSKMLIEDALNIAKRNGKGLPYGRDEYRKMKNAWFNMGFFESASFGDLSIEMYPAGHIPGACGVILKEEGNKKRVFYSSDFKLEQMRLIQGGCVPKNIHTLIIESTYAEKNHPDRRKEEERLRRIVGEAVSNGQHVIIPVFAVGRAQEILLILERYAGKIAFDGMARKASIILSRHREFLRNPEKLQDVLGRVSWIKTEKERVQAVKKYPVIVTTAGMASGGPIQYYMKRLSKSECKVIFVGYLPEGTPARKLADTGMFYGEGSRFKVNCDIIQLDLSAHADRRELLKMVEIARPEQVVCVHGDNCKKFASDIENIYGITAFAPKNMDVVDV